MLKHNIYISLAESIHRESHFSFSPLPPPLYRKKKTQKAKKWGKNLAHPLKSKHQRRSNRHNPSRHQRRPRRRTIQLRRHYFPILRLRRPMPKQHRSLRSYLDWNSKCQRNRRTCGWVLFRFKYLLDKEQQHRSSYALFDHETFNCSVFGRCGAEYLGLDIDGRCWWCCCLVVI